MKPNLKLLLAVTAAVGAALAVAQDNQPLAATPPPAPASTPPPASAPAAPAPAQKPPDGQRPPRPGPDGAPGEHREHFHHPEGGWMEHRHEGNRGPDGAEGPGPGHEGPGHFQRPPLPPPKPVPFIGVVTTQVPPILAAQLGLPEDFGLVVEQVLPDSPAAAAGLQRFDVLKLYNDQQIVDPRQLQILVRATGKDASATLTIIRKAQEQKVTVKIGEHMIPTAMHSFHHPEGMDRGGEHQRFAQRGGEHGGDQHPGEKKDGKQEGPGRPEFGHQRFAENGGGEHRGGEGRRFSHNGFGHEGFDREEGRHHGFGHHGFGRGGFGRESSHHHGFGHHGFGREGFGRQSSHHHHGFGHHRFGHEGFDREGAGHHGFHHGGFGHERFAHHGDRQNDGANQQREHGPAPQPPGQPGADHHQPADRSGRQPSPNGAPGSENRNRDWQNRPEGHRRGPSADVEEGPGLPPVEPANILREIRPGGAAEIRVEHAEGSVVYDTANAKVLFTDATGKIEIAMKDGQRTLLATDMQGQTVFEGAIETAEQLSAVPEDIRKKLDWIESRTQTELVSAPAPAAPLPSEFVQPELAGAFVQ